MVLNWLSNGFMFLEVVNDQVTSATTQESAQRMLASARWTEPFNHLLGQARHWLPSMPTVYPVCPLCSVFCVWKKMSRILV